MPAVIRSIPALVLVGLLSCAVLPGRATGVESGAVRFADPAAEIQALVDLMERRLALMPEVAAWKHARGQPVTDAAREREVLDVWEHSAAALGIERAAARAFMDVQISAAREVQERLRAEWAAGRASPRRPAT